MNEPRSVVGSPCVLTWDLLLALGFGEDHSVMSDPLPGLSYDFGNLKLSASRCSNRWFVPIVLLTGVIATKRSICELRSELPPKVESVEQGMAWVVWALDNA